MQRKMRMKNNVNSRTVRALPSPDIISGRLNKKGCDGQLTSKQWAVMKYPE
jgi:hypothetical protein